MVKTVKVSSKSEENYSYDECNRVIISSHYLYLRFKSKDLHNYSRWTTINIKKLFIKNLHYVELNGKELNRHGNFRDYGLTLVVASYILTRIGTADALAFRDELANAQYQRFVTLKQQNETLLEDKERCNHKQLILSQMVDEKNEEIKTLRVNMALDNNSKAIRLSDVSKSLSVNIGRNKLYSLLKNKGFLLKQRIYKPSQFVVDRGFAYMDGNTTWITPKGIVYISNIVSDYQQVQLVAPTVEDVRRIIRLTTGSLSFDEDAHEYRYGKMLLSATTNVTKKYFNEFPLDLAANNVAVSRNDTTHHEEGENFGAMVSGNHTTHNGKKWTKQDVLDEWTSERKRAACFGSFVHYKLECYLARNFLNNKEVREPNTSYAKFDMLKAQALIRQGIKYIHDCLAKGWEIVDTEVMMFSLKYRYAGMCDLVFWNPEKQGIILSDWKSNKDIYKNYGQYCKPPFNHWLDCPLSKYKVQLNKYHILMAGHQPYPIIKKEVVWLKDDKYEVFDIEDVTHLLIDDLESLYVKNVSKMQ